MSRDMVDQTNGWRRFEVKYLIDEHTATRIRAYCQAHMEPDPYAAGHLNNEYPVQSIYLDTQDRRLLADTLNKVSNRFKLRVRTYCHLSDQRAGQPAFCEIKQKKCGIVHKVRAQLTNGTADALLVHDDLRAGPVPHKNGRSASLEEFLQIRREIGADPVVSVYYTREAYESPGIDRVRINLDRNVHFGLIDPADRCQTCMWWPAGVNDVILEVKFSNTFPFWVRDLIARMDLTRRGVCKYALCEQAARSISLVPFA